MGGQTVVVFVGHGTRIAEGIGEFERFCTLVEQALTPVGHESVAAGQDVTAVGVGHQGRTVDKEFAEVEQALTALGYEATSEDRELTAKKDDETTAKDHIIAGHQRDNRSVRFERAFLELAEPNLVDVLRDCSMTSPDSILLVPLFLFSAGHMKSDIPALVEQARPFLRRTPVEILPAVGVNTEFAAVAVERIREGLVENGGEVVLLVGRGNRDAAAQRDFEWVAALISQIGSMPPLATGYLAGSGEMWSDALTRLAQMGGTKISIQPYLWFHGWLTLQLPKWVKEWQSSTPEFSEVRVSINEPLGVHPRLVSSIATRVRETLGNATSHSSKLHML